MISINLLEYFIIMVCRLMQFHIICNQTYSHIEMVHVARWCSNISSFLSCKILVRPFAYGEMANYGWVDKIIIPCR